MKPTRSVDLRELTNRLSELVTRGSPNEPAAYIQLPPVLKHRRTAELLNEDRGER